MYLKFTRLGICYLNLFVFCIEDRLYSQTHKPFHTTINAKCGGYYEYLPSNYDPTGSKQYPIILFIHGLGDSGNGRMPDLNKVLLSGLPTYIDRNKFPASFTVNGNQFSFIVISPQFSAWPNAQDVQDVLNYTLAKYKVDVSRIYITGLSMGGGATWDYAQSSFTAASGIAAIVPVCGESDPLAGTPEIIGQANLPVWATHNSGDPAVLVWKTNGFIDAINATNPVPRAKKSIFASNSHDAWTKTYDPLYKEEGKNIYEWMLQYSRSANAGLPVKLSDYKASLLPDKAIAISWTTTHEESNAWFIIEYSTDGLFFQELDRLKSSNISTGSSYKYFHRNPAAGSNYYRLKQIDLDGKITIFEVLKFGLLLPLSDNLQIYPNPVVGDLNIGIDNAHRGELQVNIIDNSGKILDVRYFTKNSDHWNQLVSSRKLKPGQYILELKGSNFRSSKKFLKK